MPTEKQIMKYLSNIAQETGEHAGGLGVRTALRTGLLIPNPVAKGIAIAGLVGLDATQGYNNANQYYKHPTTGNKLTSAANGILSGLTFSAIPQGTIPYIDKAMTNWLSNKDNKVIDTYAGIQ